VEDYEDCLGPVPFAEEGPADGAGEERPLPDLLLANRIQQHGQEENRRLEVYGATEVMRGGIKHSD
jgi:hypothetical protein